MAIYVKEVADGNPIGLHMRAGKTGSSNAGRQSWREATERGLLSTKAEDTEKKAKDYVSG